MTQRDRLIRRIAVALVWADESQHIQDVALRRARAIVADIYDAPAEGKAVERALRVIEENLERSA